MDALMSHHFSFFKGVPEWDENFEPDEVIDWYDKAKKALLQNSCEVTKRTVVKRFSTADYNDTINRDVVLFVSSNPFLCTGTTSIQRNRYGEDNGIWTDPDVRTDFKITYPLNLYFVRYENTKEFIMIGRRDDNSLEAVNDVLVFCEIIEFPRSALNLFSELI